MVILPVFYETDSSLPHLHCMLLTTVSATIPFVSLFVIIGGSIRWREARPLDEDVGSEVSEWGPGAEPW